MSEKPGYEELEKRIQELEQIIANSTLKDPKSSNTTISESLLSCNDFDTRKSDLGDIVDTRAIQSMMENFYSLTKIGIAILDLHGKVLVATGWQDICTEFHRIHPETCKNCLESDLELSNGIEPGTFRLYKCKNNMWDMATPIVVGGRKAGNLYLGQFFFEDEPPDVETFKLQAQKYGFDENNYITALKRVPHWSRQTVDTVMSFYTKFSHLISELGYQNFLINQAMIEKDDLNERFAVATDSAQIGVWNLDLKNNLLVWDDWMYRIYGLHPENFEGAYEAWKKGLHPDDLIRADDEVQQAINGKTPFDTQFRIIRPDGDIRHVRAFARVVRDEEGIPIKMTGVNFDITDSKRAEETLRESEQRYHSLFENMLNGFAFCRLLYEEGRPHDFIYLDVNKAFEELTGLKNVVGKRVTEVIPDIKETAGELFDIYGRVAETGNPEQFDFDFTPLNIWLHISVYSPKKGYFIAVFENITDHKQADEALRASEEKFSKAFHGAPILMTISSVEDGRYLEVNDAFVNTTGYCREATLGKTSIEIGFITPEERNKIVEILKLENRVTNLELELIHADGSKITCLYSGEIIEVEGKRRLLTIASDISEWKQAEEERKKLYAQFLQAQKMESVGRLAGGVAHDFNNKLTVILGHVQMLLMEMEPENPIYESLEEIQDAAKGSSDLTRQLLAFARKQTIAPRELDLNETVEGMLKMLRRLIGEDIDLAWKPDTNLWLVKMDPAQTDQILANLSVNARDAIGGVGEVMMETKNVVLDDAYAAQHAGFVSGEFVMLAVSDNGCGMDKTTLKQVFEPFFTTKAAGKGTGLGLSTVYGIAKQNDGFVYVYSEPGKGTTFKIYMPRYHGDTIREASTKSEETPRSKGETILLVEDDPAILRIAGMMLERLGYSVLTAEGQEKTMEIAREHPGRIHLLMTDVVMPQMNGKELAEQVIKIRPETKTLFMSGYTANVIAHQGILGKGVHFIEKPFMTDGLAWKVREVLNDKRIF